MVRASNGRTVADCEHTPHERRPAPPQEEDIANAHLIASAPDLLETLEIAVKIFNMKEIDPFKASVMIEQMKEVINKAKGLHDND